MATHTGAQGASKPQVFFHLPGRDPSIGIPFDQPPFSFEPISIGTQAGTITNVTKSGTKTIATHSGVQDDRSGGPMGHWFEIVHVTPRAKINFGNIITLVQEEYEIYSAFRKQSVTLSSITNNALPGVDPNITPSVVVPPQSSILDASSTDNSSGTGLGTLVKTKIDADQDGLSQFDTTVVFNFNSPANDVTLYVTGSRVVLIPMQYEAPVQETLAFLTDIITAIDGNEQRIALRDNPRQLFEVEYLLDNNDRQRMQALLMEWTDKIFGFPLYHEATRLTADHTGGGTTYAITQGDVIDFRVGGQAVVITDNATYDVITISAVTSTQITATSASVNSHSAGAVIMPMRLAYIRGAIPSTRPSVKLERFRVKFEVIENDEGALAGSTTPGFWSLYNSKVLFDDCNVIERGRMPAEYQRRVVFIDNGTGNLYGSSPWDKGKRISQKGFVVDNRSDILDLRKVLIAINGRQKSFYVPTFIEDLTAADDLAIGADTIDITSIDYVRLIQDREPKATFRITFTDGTSLIRIVQSSATVSSTIERLTLNTTWPANRTTNEIQRIEFYELVRFDTDNIQITYPRVGFARVFAPVKQVFD